jgi:hypothetical protein
MRLKLVILAWLSVMIVLGILSVGMQQAHAAGRVCGERSTIVEYLKERYKETPRAVGVASSGKSVMEIYTSEKGSWTVLMTTAKGITCIMAAGHSWEDREQNVFYRKS